MRSWFESNFLNIVKGHLKLFQTTFTPVTICLCVKIYSLHGLEDVMMLYNVFLFHGKIVNANTKNMTVTDLEMKRREKWEEEKRRKEKKIESENRIE